MTNNDIYTIDFEQLQQNVKSILFTDGKFISKRSRKEYFERNNQLPIYEALMNIYPEKYSLSQRVWLCLNNIKEINKCKICKNEYVLVHVLNGIATQSLYCSTECCRKDLTFSMRNMVRDEDTANEKRKKTMIEKYGCAYNGQREDVKVLLRKYSNKKYPWKVYLEDKDWLYNEYHVLKKSSIIIGEEIGTHYGTVLAHIDKFGIERRNDFSRSSHEMLLENKIKEVYSGELILNDKTIIKPYHIDLVLPEFKFGVEVNGVFYHAGKDSQYHRNKTISAKSSGYDLFHFTDLEIDYKQDLVVSMIKNKIGLSTKIGARKCEFGVVTPKQAEEFFSANHISGHVRSSIYIGLYHDNKLVQCCSFGKPRFSKETDYEIIRFATLIGYNVVGGFSKILKKFKTEYPGSIISYCDRRYGTGDVYLKNDFNFVRETSPGYIWVKSSLVYSRYQTQKHKIKDLLKNKFAGGDTENEMMENAGFRKLWDCGHLVFIKINN